MLFYLNLIGNLRVVPSTTVDSCIVYSTFLSTLRLIFRLDVTTSGPHSEKLYKRRQSDSRRHWWEQFPIPNPILTRSANRWFHLEPQFHLEIFACHAQKKESVCTNKDTNNIGWLVRYKQPIFSGARLLRWRSSDMGWRQLRYLFQGDLYSNSLISFYWKITDAFVWLHHLSTYLVSK